MLHELNHRGLTIVVSTPYMDEAEYASRIGFIDGGRLVDIGSRAEILGHFDRPLVGVQTPDRVAAKAVLRAIAGIDDVSLFGTSLHVRGTDGSSEALAGRVRAAFTQAGSSAAVDVQPIEPSLEDVFVLRSEAGEHAS
jgi:ABC-2 type transport system ATP-binding protein